MITRVTDLRTGYRHPARNSHGQFISRQDSARFVHWMARSTQTIHLDVAPSRSVLDHVRFWFHK